MILCVTLNPCLDKTLDVPAWRPGDSIRGTAVREQVGGKGNNVARALRCLGRHARPTTFLGGPTGALCAERLREDDGLDPFIIHSIAPTRTILTVRSTAPGVPATAFFDPDPAISGAEVQTLLILVERELTGGEVEALTLSGSSPSLAAHEAYAELVALARARNVPVFLDTYGPALKAIWGFWPDVVQLNRREAADYLGRAESELTDAVVLDMLAGWSRRGVKLALVTDGPRPVLARAGDRAFRALPPALDRPPVNPIGSGDSLLAGLVDGWLFGRGVEDLIRRGLACAAANCETWDAGEFDPERVVSWEERVAVETI